MEPIYFFKVVTQCTKYCQITKPAHVHDTHLRFLRVAAGPPVFLRFSGGGGGGAGTLAGRACFGGAAWCAAATAARFPAALAAGRNLQ